MLIFATAAPNPHPLMLIPFVLMLASIAMMPLLNHHWWERFYPAVSFGLAAVTVTYYVVGLREFTRIGHVAHEYLSFVVLIGSLYMVAGGIHIRVKGEATPWVNSIFLLIGAVLANLIGKIGRASCRERV